MAKTHAEILADIAAEVAAGYRNTLVPIPGELGVIEPTNVPVPEAHDPSWDYVLPERYQG